LVFRVQDLMFWIEGFELRVQGLGFRVKGLYVEDLLP
jgi:hypothetical protein